MNSSISQVREGTVRALAHTGNRPRINAAPDVPALSETLPGFATVEWNGIFVRTGTPAPIVERLSALLNEIVADPTTLTGSIGVYGGKFALGPALSRFGVDVRETHVGNDFSGAFGMGQGFSPTDRAAFARWMDRIYAGFITRVADGRGLPEARVREIAKGRVWTGVQAKQLGLVDEIGGFYQAVERAKTLAGIKGDAHLKRLTTPVSPFEAIEQALGVSAMSMRTLAASAWLLGDPRAQGILDDMAETRMGAGHSAVKAPVSQLR